MRQETEHGKAGDQGLFQEAGFICHAAEPTKSRFTTSARVVTGIDG